MGRRSLLVQSSKVLIQTRSFLRCLVCQAGLLNAKENPNSLCVNWMVSDILEEYPIDKWSSKIYEVSMRSPTFPLLQTQVCLWFHLLFFHPHLHNLGSLWRHCWMSGSTCLSSMETSTAIQGSNVICISYSSRLVNNKWISMSTCKICSITCKSSGRSEHSSSASTIRYILLLLCRIMKSVSAMSSTVAVLHPFSHRSYSRWMSGSTCIVEICTRDNASMLETVRFPTWPEIESSSWVDNHVGNHSEVFSFSPHRFPRSSSTSSIDFAFLFRYPPSALPLFIYQHIEPHLRAGSTDLDSRTDSIMHGVIISRLECVAWREHRDAAAAQHGCGLPRVVV